MRLCVHRFPEAKLWKTHGVDAVFYLRALKMYLILTVGMNIGSLIVLLPINLTAKHVPQQETNSTISSNAALRPSSDYYLDDGADLVNGTVSGMARFTLASLMHGWFP